MNEIIMSIASIFAENPLSQNIWLIAFVIWLIWYISSKDIMIKILWAISVFLFGIHFLLLWLYVWWILSLLWTLRNIFDFVYAIYWNSMWLLISTVVFTIWTSLSIAKIKYPNWFVYNFFEWTYFKSFSIFIKNKLLMNQWSF